MKEKEHNKKTKHETNKDRLFELYIKNYISETQYYKIKERIKGKKKRG